MRSMIRIMLVVARDLILVGAAIITTVAVTKGVHHPQTLVLAGDVALVLIGVAHIEAAHTRRMVIRVVTDVYRKGLVDGATILARQAEHEAEDAEK